MDLPSGLAVSTGIGAVLSPWLDLIKDLWVPKRWMRVVAPTGIFLGCFLVWVFAFHDSPDHALLYGLFAAGGNQAAYFATVQPLVQAKEAQQNEGV